jgi:L-alanine-DL-glutamate epimerase-like enolase superfamily enzyme
MAMSTLHPTTEVIVQVFTDVGLIGLGGASRYSGPERMMRYAQEVIEPYLIGKNPFDVEHLTGGRSGHGALGIWSGIDVALWDIIGKAKGVPVYRLLAMDTEPVTRLRVYASGKYSREGSRPGPDHLVEEAPVQPGLSAFKFAGAGFRKYGITMTSMCRISKLRSASVLTGPDPGGQLPLVGGTVPGDRAGAGEAFLVRGTDRSPRCEAIVTTCG